MVTTSTTYCGIPLHSDLYATVDTDTIRSTIDCKADIEELNKVKEQLETLEHTSHFYGDVLEPFIDMYIDDLLKSLEEELICECEQLDLPRIVNIDFQPPLTVVCWEDGVKTFVKAIGSDKFDPEKGAAMAIAKRYFNNDYKYFEIIDYFVEKYYKKHPEEAPCSCNSSCNCNDFNCKDRLEDEIAEMSAKEAEELIEKIMDIQQKKKGGKAHV